MLPADFHWGAPGAFLLLWLVPCLLLLWGIRRQLTHHHLRRYLAPEAEQRLASNLGYTSDGEVRVRVA